MQFEIAADDGTDDATEPVSPGTSCTCGGDPCNCYVFDPEFC